MPISAGSIPETNSVAQTDTAELRTYVNNAEDVPAPSAELVSVEFTVRQPDGTQTTEIGDIEADGAGFLRYTDTADPGIYQWVAQFTFVTGEKRSYRDQFSVYDPFADEPITQATEIAEEVWMRLEDCFDSDLGGPWLRDATLAYFDPSKVERFISEGLMRINAWPPTTGLTLTDFTTPVPVTDPSLPPGTTQPDPDRILIVQATLLSVIRHLMRAYVEQPDVRGANVVFQDKRDYLQRWQAIYQIEEAFYKEIVTLWKRQFYNFGKGALLTHTKAGRLYPAGFRARNAARGIGY
jgi:hypothetical protein